MRIFTAIALPDQVKAQVAEVTRGRLPLPYVNTENLHIKLNFFGELDTDQVEKIKSIFPQVCSGKKPFAVVFDKVVAHHNRQIHMTIKNNSELNALQHELELAFEKEGFKFQERSYYAHVKLANMHLDNVMNRDRKLENFPHEELQALNFTANMIVLYESKLLLHHPKYIPLMEQPLL
jgi:2'-5' RNA ligase